MMTFSWFRDDSLYLIDPDAFWHHISTPGKHFHWFVLKKGFHTHCHKLCCLKKWCVQIQFFVLLLNLLELHSLLQMCLFQPKTNAFKNTMSSVTTTLIKNDMDTNSPLQIVLVKLFRHTSAARNLPKSFLQTQLHFCNLCFFFSVACQWGLQALVDERKWKK